MAAPDPFSSLRAKNIAICVPASHGSHPTQRRTLLLPPSRTAQQVSFWYRRYLSTRDFSWLMKIEAVVYHSDDPNTVPWMHAISDEVYSYETNQTIPDVVHLVALCNNMHTESTKFPNRHASIEAHWLHRYLTYAEAFRELVRQPGFDTNRIKAAGLGVWSIADGNQLQDMQQFRDEISGEEPLDENRNYIAESANIEFKMLQEGEAIDQNLANIRGTVLPYTPSGEAVQRAVEALEADAVRDRAARKLAQNQRKRAAQKMKKKQPQSIISSASAAAAATSHEHHNSDEEEPGSNL